MDLTKVLNKRGIWILKMVFISKLTATLCDSIKNSTDSSLNYSVGDSQ